jgi:hypothetical protein
MKKLQNLRKLDGATPLGDHSGYIQGEEMLGCAHFHAIFHLA